jgi:hypothetical protein
VDVVVLVTVVQTYCVVVVVQFVQVVVDVLVVVEPGVGVIVVVTVVLYSGGVRLRDIFMVELYGTTVTTVTLV